MSADRESEDGDAESALLGLARAFEGGDTEAVLVVCVAVLAALLVLATCCVIRLRWRIAHMQGQTRTRKRRAATTDGEGERSQLHPKKGGERNGTASPSAEQDFAAEDESA